MSKSPPLTHSRFSPEPSSASDSDSFNTDSARLHFGPLKTPERRFVAKLNPCTSLNSHHTSPSLRRSPRLNSPIPQLLPSNSIDVALQGNGLVETSEQEPEDFRHTTPERNIFLEDGPSSILAERILRAHDNPSPPPPPPIPTFDDGPGPSHVNNPSSTPQPTPCSVVLGMVAQPAGQACDSSLLSQHMRSLPDLMFPEPSSTPSADIPANNLVAPPSHSYSFTNNNHSVIHSPSPRLASPQSQLRISPNKTSLVKDQFVEQKPVSNDIGLIASQAPDPVGTNDDEDIFKPSVYHISNFEPPSETLTATISSEVADTLSLKEEKKVEIPALQLNDTNVEVQDTDNDSKRIIEDAERSHIPFTENVVHEIDSMSLSTATASTAPILHVPTLQPSSDSSMSNIAMQQPTSISSQLQPQLLTENTSQTSSGRSSPSPSPLSPPPTPQPAHNRPPPTHTPNLLSTPARRVPITQAIMEGRISLQKTEQIANRRLPGPSFGLPRTPVLNITKSDSPARRVLVTDESTPVAKSLSNLRSARPLVRAKDKMRLLEPRTSVRDLRDKKPQERPQDFGSNSQTPSSQSIFVITRLPFPLVADGSEKSTSHQGSAMTGRKDLDNTASPSKTSLKCSTSRIPRIGTKPYSRPISSQVSQTRKVPRVMRTVEISKHVVDTNVPPNSTAMGRIPEDTLPNLPNSKNTAIATASTSTSHLAPSAVISSSSNNLKRKRGFEVVPLVNKSKSIVKIRQVPPKLLSKNVPGSPQKSSSLHSDQTLTGQIGAVDRGSGGKLEAFSVVEVATSVPIHPNGTVEEHLGAPPSSSPEPPKDRLSSPEPPAEERSQTSVRRTTRLRKPNTVESSQGTRPLQPRRKANNQVAPDSDNGFLGMSATAIRALTTSNTVRNQQYLAAQLETKVVRLEGTRPMSPAVKIKTVVQKREEDRKRQRKERAERRSGNKLPDVFDQGSDEVDAQESDSDSGSNSPLSRHRRGAGDEEDYETPDRHYLISKRQNLMESLEADQTKMERRVKWDKGLFAAICLDEVKLGAREPPRSLINIKGCLAPTSKAAQLDPLGNLAHAGVPLTELVKENVTVTKFVYDDDLELEEVTHIKNTRSKSKKNKS